MVRNIKKSYKKKSIKNKSRKLKKVSKKQKVYVMKGCSRCGPNCNCPHKCPGNCYLNKVIKNKKGGYTPGAFKSLGMIHGGEKPIAPLPFKKGGNGSIYTIPKTSTNLSLSSIQHNPTHSQPHVQNYHNYGVPTFHRGGNTNYYDSASRTRTLKGGSGFYKQPANMPSPLIGQSWGGKINNWSSVDGVGSNRNYLDNYLENNLYKGDPQTSMKLDYSNGFKGGASIVPQDLTNIGRMLQYNIGTAYNSVNGYSKPINPLPYSDQFNTKLNNNIKIPL